MDVSQLLVTQTSLVGQYALFLRVLPDFLGSVYGWRSAETENLAKMGIGSSP